MIGLALCPFLCVDNLNDQEIGNIANTKKMGLYTCLTHFGSSRHAGVKNSRAGLHCL